MTLLVTGSIEVSFTNLSTGKTIFENTSGPGKATINNDGSVTLALKGHNAMVRRQPMRRGSDCLPCSCLRAR
jgi:hypothetical protein